MAVSREIGPFEVLEKLGAGGMGEVFKARDTRLNRFVALKFLPEAASDAARERFQREALAIAALNHPHICTLYEVGEDQGRPYLVLELLEGETLKARLRRGALDTDQLLDCSVQISDALDAAHRKGVLHRDLKPENIWVAPGGHIKVLDFGLARLEADAASGETLTSPAPLTSPGVAMGTFPYMSPEQAKGEPLDARSDIFSFGSVFYEMASGRSAFGAASAAEVVAGILKGQPKKLSQVRPNVAPMIEQVAERCLEKEPDLRYQSAADLRGELKRLKRESGAAEAGDRVPASTPAAPMVEPLPSDSQLLAAVLRRRWYWPALAVAVLAAGALAWWHYGARTASPPPLLEFHQLTFNGHVLDAVISPDGKFLAHVDQGPQGVSLHLLSVVNGSDVQIVPPGTACCQSPSFSPDGSAVYFLANRVLKAVPVLGGTARTIADPACSGAGFSPDGSQIAFLTNTSQGSAVNLARPDGTAGRTLHSTPLGQGYVSQCLGAVGNFSHSPAWSPDGHWLALDLFGSDLTEHIQLVNTADGSTRMLGGHLRATDPDPNWLPDGSGLVFTAAIPAGTVPQAWTLSFPAGHLTQLTNDLQGYASASLSVAGTLSLVHASPEFTVWTEAHADGDFHPLPGGGATQDGSVGLAWTPTGSLLSTRTLGDKTQLWSTDADGSASHALPLDPNLAAFGTVVVAPDGTIVFEEQAKDSITAIWRANRDGGGLARLTPGDSQALDMWPTIIQGSQVAYLHVDTRNHQTLWTVPLAGGTPRQLWSGFVYVDGNPASPDGTALFALSRGALPGASPDAHVAIVVRLDRGAPQVTPLNLDYKTMRWPYGWTPDGRAITYLVNRGTIDNIWAYPLDGHKPYAITHFTDLNIANYAFSRDGRLAISRGSQNSDAVVATGLTGSGSHGR